MVEGSERDQGTGAVGAVLVVDDDPMVNSLMSESLRVAGFDVVTASSGAEALDRLAEGIPDVIVSDVMMPTLSGFELIGRIRAQIALGWFIVYLFVSNVFYTKFKNLIARIAQVKGLMGDRQWKLTPLLVTEPIP